MNKEGNLMKKNRRKGLLCVLVGFGILLISSVLSTGYVPQLGYLGSIQNMDTVLKNGRWIPYPSISGEIMEVQYEGRIFKVPAGLKYQEKVLDYIKNTYEPSFLDRILGNEYGESYHYKGRIAFSYKYCLSLGIILIFIGTGVFFFSKQN
jgi:hypothetical protein